MGIEDKPCKRCGDVLSPLELSNRGLCEDCEEFVDRHYDEQMKRRVPQDEWL